MLGMYERQFYLGRVRVFNTSACVCDEITSHVLNFKIQLRNRSNQYCIIVLMNVNVTFVSVTGFFTL